MNIQIDETFTKDLRKLKTKSLEKKVADFIIEALNPLLFISITNLESIQTKFYCCT